MPEKKKQGLGCGLGFRVEGLGLRTLRNPARGCLQSPQKDVKSSRTNWCISGNKDTAQVICAIF